MVPVPAHTPDKTMTARNAQLVNKFNKIFHENVHTPLSNEQRLTLDHAKQNIKLEQENHHQEMRHRQEKHDQQMKLKELEMNMTRQTHTLKHKHQMESNQERLRHRRENHESFLKQHTSMKEQAETQSRSSHEMRLLRAEIQVTKLKKALREENEKDVIHNNIIHDLVTTYIPPSHTHSTSTTHRKLILKRIVWHIGMPQRGHKNKLQFSPMQTIIDSFVTLQKIPGG